MKYKTLNPVRHNGELHDTDAVLELDDQDAALLLDCGAIAPQQEESKDSEGETDSVEKDQEPEKAETKPAAKPPKGKGSKAK